MKRKITAAVLCVGLSMGMTANAQTIIVPKTGNSVVIEESIDPNATAVLIAVRSGKSIEDDDQVYAMCHAVANDVGLAVFSFDMPEVKGDLSSDGEYDIYIRQAGKTLIKSKIIYANQESRTTLLEKINKVSSRNDLTEILDNADNQISLKAIGCDMGVYSALGTGKASATAIMYDYAGNFSQMDFEKFIACFNAALTVEGINQLTDAQADKYLKLIDLSYENIRYSEITDSELKTWLSNCIYKNKKYISVAELIAAYNQANVLYIINHTRVDGITDVLSKYAAKLDIDSSTEYKAYLALSSYTAVNEKIVIALKSTPVYTPTELKLIIKKAMDAVRSGSKNNSDNGSGGNSDKKSSDTGITSGIPVESKEEITGKPKQDYFSDLDEAGWASEAINKMAEAGIVAGDENGNFRPNDTMKREEFVKMLVSAAGMLDEDAICEFEDVIEGAWYYKSIASAFNAGLVYGVSDERFGVGNVLTRQDMMVLCSRAINKFRTLEAVREDNVFTDNDQISEYAKEAISQLYMAGIANGMEDNTFCPLATATRAQGALIIYNLFLK